MSPVQISKHIMSVESAEVEAAQAPPADVFFLGVLSFKHPDGLETLQKKYLYVHRPDVQSGEDTLVASLGADEMRAMHLTDASRLSLAAGIWVLGSWTLSIRSVLPYIIFNDEGARHREDIWQIRLGGFVTLLSLQLLCCRTISYPRHQWPSSKDVELYTNMQAERMKTVRKMSLF